MLGCFDGALVSWSISKAPDADVANAMLEDACATLGAGERPVIHSDRGCHYRWPGWISICDSNGPIRSMPAKGSSPGDSRMEGFFGRPKNEFFYGRDWAGATLGEFIGRLDAYLRYHDEARPKEGLGWMSPLEYRRSLGPAAWARKNVRSPSCQFSCE